NLPTLRTSRGAPGCWLDPLFRPPICRPTKHASGRGSLAGVASGGASAGVSLLDQEDATRLGRSGIVPGAAEPGTQENEDALTALISLVQADLEACNRVIVARMDSPVALIPQLAA